MIKFSLAPGKTDWIPAVWDNIQTKKIQKVGLAPTHYTYIYIRRDTSFWTKIQTPEPWHSTSNWLQVVKLADFHKVSGLIWTGIVLFRLELIDETCNGKGSRAMGGCSEVVTSWRKFHQIMYQKGWRFFEPTLEFACNSWKHLIIKRFAPARFAYTIKWWVIGRRRPPSRRCSCSSVETELTGFTFFLDDQRFRNRSASVLTKGNGTKSSACSEAGNKRCLALAKSDMVFKAGPDLMIIWHQVL